MCSVIAMSLFLPVDVTGCYETTSEHRGRENKVKTHFHTI